MREKLLLAAVLTITLKLFAGVSESFTNQAPESLNWQNQRVVTITQLNQDLKD